MTISICAAICGADAWTDVERFGKAKQSWFKGFLELPYGIPSHDTFGRVFAMLDTTEFFHCLQSWLGALNVATDGQVIAIDGKTLRGSFDKASGKAALHMVNAWATGNQLVLGQVAVDSKSNEITAIPRLLELIEVAGGIVTIDAMGCQKAIASKIREKGADYLLAVKDNQPTLHEEISDAFLEYAEDHFSARKVRTHKTRERSHGREEQREYYIAPVPQNLSGKDAWKDLCSIGMAIRHRSIDGKESTEVAYYISSLPPKVRQFAAAARSHWGVENSLHWCLDVTFSEDKSRIRKGNGPEISGMLRRLALSILKQDTSLKSSIRGKRLIAGWNEEALTKILAGFSGV